MKADRVRSGAAALLATTLVATWLVTDNAVPEIPRRNHEGEPLPTGASHDRWELTFQDEFSGTELDDQKWVTCYWWDDGGCTNLGNKNAQWYLPSALSVSGGSLIIEATEQRVVGVDGREFPYVSGIVTTGRDRHDMDIEPRYAFTYGWVEGRLRAPSGRGLWTALWLLPVTHESKPEIDVVEILGHQTSTFEAHLHWRNAAGEARSDGAEWHGPDFADGFHTFGVEWDAEYIRWYVDGVARWEVRNAERISHEPMYLLANLAVGGEWSGYPNGNTEFPAHLEIDYIRVWTTPRQR